VVAVWILDDNLVVERFLRAGSLRFSSVDVYDNILGQEFALVQFHTSPLSNPNHQIFGMVPFRGSFHKHRGLKI
jgi:hypothetical protein